MWSQPGQPSKMLVSINKRSQMAQRWLGGLPSCLYKTDKGFRLLPLPVNRPFRICLSPEWPTSYLYVYIYNSAGGSKCVCAPCSWFLFCANFVCCALDLEVAILVFPCDVLNVRLKPEGPVGSLPSVSSPPPCGRARGQAYAVVTSFTCSVVLPYLKFLFPLPQLPVVSRGLKILNKKRQRSFTSF